MSVVLIFKVRNLLSRLLTSVTLLVVTLIHNGTKSRRDGTRLREVMSPLQRTCLRVVRRLTRQSAALSRVTTKAPLIRLTG